MSRFDPLPAMYAEKCSAHGFRYSLHAFETLNVDAYGCPSCGSADRERLFALFLTRELAKASRDRRLRLLDIAPVPWLSVFLKESGWFAYRSADLAGDLADDCVDIMQMPYEDASFDIFICSHVLEHVSDDRQALSELRRILVPGGLGLLMVPICLSISGVEEDPGERDEGERWRRFGQGDHVRLYGRDGFRQRVEDAGFQLHALGAPYFGRRSFRRGGISPGSVLYVVDRRLGEEPPSALRSRMSDPLAMRQSEMR